MYLFYLRNLMAKVIQYCYQLFYMSEKQFFELKISECFNFFQIRYKSNQGMSYATYFSILEFGNIF